MSYLLFLDESGHDHRNTPYEVRGGIALHAEKLWHFATEVRSLEESCFGDYLHRYGSEIKGARQLEKKRFRWALQAPEFDEVARRKHSLSFLQRTRAGQIPTRQECTAYGQASLALVRGIFELLRAHGAVLFAAAIPRKVTRPATPVVDGYLRKNLVFLLERYFYFLERERESGLLVLDETDSSEDRRLVQRLEQYFRKTDKGRFRASRIVSSPFFVASDMTCPVQVADLCVYCINWGFRLPARGMDAETRPEIAEEFGPWLNELQYHGNHTDQSGTHQIFGITYVPDPYTGRS